MRSAAELWAGSFGDEYHERNRDDIDRIDRWPFWRELYARWPVGSVLEVGCGTGINLACAVPPKVAGIDINPTAIQAAQHRVARARLVVADAAHIVPIPDQSYELVFTCGLLIHIPPSHLATVMNEIWRISARHILIMEYGASHETMIEYRGKLSMLWKRPYRALFEDRYALEHLDGGFLARPAFDDLEWDLWRKRS